MDFMDELKDKATDVAAVTGKKVAEIYSATKLKIAISDKKSQLGKLYKELGKLVYKTAKGEYESEDSNEIEDKIQEIDLVIEVIEELKAAEGQLKNMKFCPECKSRMEDKANFCPNCGKEI